MKNTRREKLIKQSKMFAIINNKIKERKERRIVHEIKDISIEAFKYRVSRTTKRWLVEGLPFLKRSTRGSLTPQQAGHKKGGKNYAI